MILPIVIVLQGLYTWIDGTPLTYRNFLSENRSVEIASSQSLDLSSIKIDDVGNEEQRMLMKTYKEQLVARSTKELFVSHNASSSHCVAMATNLLIVGKWVPIGCEDMVDSAWVVCEEKYIAKQKGITLYRQLYECQLCK